MKILNTSIKESQKTWLTIIIPIIGVFWLFASFYDVFFLKNRYIELPHIPNSIKKIQSYQPEIQRNQTQLNHTNAKNDREVLISRSTIETTFKYSMHKNAIPRKNIKEMAQFANLPYCLPTMNNVDQFVNVPDVIVDFLMKKVSPFPPIENREIIVYFRGKELSLNEWKQREVNWAVFQFPNVSSIPSKNPLVDKVWYEHAQKMINEGQLFKKIARLVVLAREKQVENHIQILKVKFTGHGIGGAYAVLAGCLYELEALKDSLSDNRDRMKLFSDQIEIYSFGQPRIGNKNFAKLVNEKCSIVRVTHTNDYVPQFPVAKEGEQYVHSNVEHWIASRECDCPNPDEYKPIYRCEVFGDPGENPNCNSGQLYKEAESYLAHKGPYLGITIGDCKTGMEGMQR
ncbi:hypothetical protein G9A89_002337 [Geosiphon pyriformis]|nr:hypothetical protein G9A89_002337 [Geosiphon pyriformis]